MNTIMKGAAVLGIAGLVAAATVTPSDARSGRTAAAAAGGFVAGAAIGAAAANASSGPYYYNSYNYAPGYRAYAYQPAPVYTAPAYTAPVYGFRAGTCWVETDPSGYGDWGSCAEEGARF